MKRLWHVILMVCFFISQTHAQNNSKDSIIPRRTAVYFEVGGPALTYSFNVDHLFLLSPDPSVGIGLRVGLSYFSILSGIDYSSIVFAVPMEGYFSLGRKLCLEFGIGNSLFVRKEWSAWDPAYSGTTSTYFIQSIRLGCKYRGKQGLILALSPMLLFNRHDSYVSPYAGFAVGYSF